MSMKAMKNTMKCLIAVFMMAMAFAVTGITAQAIEATYAPATWSDFNKDPVETSKTYQVPANSYIVIPVKIPAKGCLYYSHAHGTSQFGLSANIYVDAACTTTASDYFYPPSDTEVVTSIYNFTKGGTYYLKVRSSNKVPVNYAISSFFISGADRTLKSGKTTVMYQNDYNKWIYNKFKATKTGYIAVSASELNNGSVNIQLMNKKKKALSDQDSVQNGTLYFGVKKGQTYYVATKGGYDDIYALKIKQTAIKEKSGSSKSKAVTMKRNKTYKGVQIADKKKSGNDWYKFKLTSKKKFKLTIKGGATGSYVSPYYSDNYSSDIGVKIIPANKYQTLRGAYSYVINGTSTLESSGKLSAGTYYVQIYKCDKMASGWYSLKWK